MSVGYGSGVGRHRVTRWDNLAWSFGVHASAAGQNSLGIADAEMGHLGLAVTLAQSVVLGVANASQGHLAENIYDLGAANATLGHTVAAPGQTQLQILVVVSDDQGHEATPNILTKNLVGVGADMPHTADPDILVKNVLQANATQGHEGTALQMTLTVNGATMGHEGLAVAFPAGGGANLTVVAGTMPHDGFGIEVFSPSILPDLQIWLAPDSVTSVSGGRVAQWSDKSGIGNHATQIFNSAMPTHISAIADLNGHNAVQFVPGRVTRLYASNVAAVCAMSQSGLSNWSGTIVVESSTGNNGTLYHMGSTSANTNRRSISLATGRYNFTEVVAGISTVQAIASNKLTPVVLRWTWTSGHVSVWENGVSVTADAKLSAGTDTALGAAPHLSIGTDTGGGNAFFGHVAEVICAATAWSSAQGRELDKLLGAKYGITIT